MNMVDMIEKDEEGSKIENLFLTQLAPILLSAEYAFLRNMTNDQLKKYIND